MSLSFRVLCCRSISPLLRGWYEVVIWRWIPRREQSSDHRLEVNWRSLSVTMEDGAPKRDTQCRRRAVAQSDAVMEERGIASNQRDKRSMTVIR